MNLSRVKILIAVTAHGSIYTPSNHGFLLFLLGVPKGERRGGGCTVCLDGNVMLSHTAEGISGGNQTAL